MKLQSDVRHGISHIREQPVPFIQKIMHEGKQIDQRFDAVKCRGDSNHTNILIGCEQMCVCRLLLGLISIQ